LLSVGWMRSRVTLPAVFAKFSPRRA
jgi:hypothetical protein